MERSFGETVEAWHDFYVVLGGASAAMLGLLFVAASLRLNLFRDERLADVRTYAFQTLIGFFLLVLISLIYLMPEPSPSALGIPLICVGAGGAVSVAAVCWRAWQMRSGEGPQYWLPMVYMAVQALAYVALIVMAAITLDGRTGALRWLGFTEALLLGAATLNAWMLLSHAGGDAEG